MTASTSVLELVAMSLQTCATSHTHTTRQAKYNCPMLLTGTVSPNAHHKHRLKLNMILAFNGQLHVPKQPP